VIDALASQPHYLRHLYPVWQALPEEYRGTLYLTGRASWEAPFYDTGRVYSGLFQRPGPRVLVASQTDYRQVSTGRRVIYMNHGAGQSYGGDPDPAVSRDASYAGGDGQDRTDLFLVPGPHPAQRCRERYPDIPVVEIGCPALDSWLNRPARREPHEKPVVALAFQRATRHGDYPLCPEHVSALPHYLSALPALMERFEVLGHGHPRAKAGLEAVYGPLGIPWVDWETVMLTADVLCVDNSSIGFEAAAIGLPVIWLNAPWYRREIDHGLRFWGTAGVGMEVDEPAALVPTVETALRIWLGWYGLAPADQQLSYVYTRLDGHCAQRGAAAIVALDAAELAEVPS
jgi:hypothetical protein